MSLTVTGTGHAIGSTPLASDGPFTIFGWFNPTSLGQFKRFFSIANSSDINQHYGLGTDNSTTSGAASAFCYQSAASGTQRTGATLTTGNWVFLAGTYTASGTPGLVVGTATRVVSGGSGFNPTINETLLSGRSSDFSNGLAGQFAHLGGVVRILADIEFAWLGGGGNPQYLDYARYWRCAATETSTITDYKGQENLTCTSISAGTTDPIVGTFWTAAALSAQSATQGSAITSIDFTTKFDKPAASVDYTCTLVQRGSAGTPTTTTAAATTASNVVTVTSAAGFTEGGYASITDSAHPLLILKISGNTMLLGGFGTWANAANVYPFAVTTKTFTFYSSGNTFSGTPAAGDVGTYTLIPRAANSTTSTLIADGPAFQFTVAASGAAPSFSAGPTLTTATTDGYTFGATSNQTATWYAVAMLRGSTAPTAAQVKSGSPTGFVSRFNVALTAATPGTLTYTGLTLPVYDLYHVVDNGSGTSAVSSFTNQLKTAPAGSQYVRATIRTITAITKANPVNITCTGHGLTTGNQVEVYGASGMSELNALFTGGALYPCTVVDANHITLPIDSTGFTTYTSGGSLAWGNSIFKDASTVIATGDIAILDAVSSPDGATISCQADGSVSLQVNAVTRRQNFTANVYSVSGQALVGSAVFYLNDIAPQPPITAGNVPPAFFVPANQAITPINVVTLATDAQGDTLTAGITGLPAGLTYSAPNITGTTSSTGITPITITWTNAASESASATYNLVVGTITPPNVTGMQQGDIVNLLTANYLNVVFGTQNSSATAGTAIAQNPAIGVPVAPNSTINVTLSNGIVTGGGGTGGGGTGGTTTPTVKPILKSTVLQGEEKLNALASLQVFENEATVYATPTDASGTVYRFFRVPACARVHECQLMNDANPFGSSYALGLYLPNGGGEVVPGSSSILLPSGTSLDQGRPVWTDLYTPIVLNSPASVAHVGKTLWQLLGLPKDPSPATHDQFYDVALTALTPGQLGGNIALRMSYLRNPDRGLIAAAGVIG